LGVDVMATPEPKDYVIWPGTGGTTPPRSGGSDGSRTKTSSLSLSGAQQNAYEAMLAVLRSYGLESLAGVLLQFFQDGLSEAEINIRIQETAEYKARFAGNEERRRQGLPVLSPAEYLSVEATY